LMNGTKTVTSERGLVSRRAEQRQGQK